MSSCHPHSLLTHLVHGGVLVQTVDVPGHCAHHPHGVQMGEGSLTTAQSAGQQLDDAPDVGGIAELDHVKAAVGQKDLKGGLVVLTLRHDPWSPVTLRWRRS